jgi:hypothetical protein
VFSVRRLVADTLIQIAEEAKTQPDLPKTAPHSALIRRLEEVNTANDMGLCYALGCA